MVVQLRLVLQVIETCGKETKEIEQIDMAYKMKHTNGKKADRSSFPFKGKASKPGDSPMDFNTEAAGDGAIQGAKMGMVLGPWGAVAGAAVGGIAAGWESDAMKAEQQRAKEAEARKKEENAALGRKGDSNVEVGEAKGSYGASDPLNPDSNKSTSSLKPKRDNDSNKST